MRTGITQIWLSKELAENESIKPGLGKFINRFVGQTGNNDRQGAHFVTFSLSEDEIKKIASDFNKTVWHPKTSTKFIEPQFPNFVQHRSFFFLKHGLEFHRAHSDEEHLVLNEPNIEEGVMGGQYWFTDTYIQFRPERFTNIIGKDYWWQLPRRNSILYDLDFFDKPARINEHGMFSVLMRRCSQFDPDENTLVVKLPDDSSIFSSFICGEKYDCYQNGSRERFLSRPFYTIRRSDKGKYLSGVLSLFPDMLNAHCLFEERYWRQIFERMSNQSDTKDERKKEEIFNKLKKNIDRGRDFNNSEDDIKWLAEKVLILSKNYAKRGIDLSFRDLTEDAIRETDEYNKKSSGDKIEFDKNGLKNTISELLDWKVLLLGIRPRCPRCGYKIWSHIDEINQRIICKGCNYEFTIQPEEQWFYSLNTLVRAATSLHGTVPVLLALGQMMGDARSSFMFMPSIDLFKKEENSSGKAIHYGEIDLVCIKDGKFVIGEIKKSVGLFKVKDFERMGELAELIKPDVIIFSSLNEKPNKFVEENITKLKQKVSHLEIDVRWYPINYWAFGPSPVG